MSLVNRLATKVSSAAVIFQSWGATPLERRSVMPGDELFIGPAHNGTRAITIEAPRSLVFDFIAQMGFGRAGWYSYDLIDNLGRPSASEVEPEWLVRQAGEPVPGGPIDFVAEIVERPSYYVLRLPTRHRFCYTIEFTLAYRLDEQTVPVPATRVVTRVRTSVVGPGGRLLGKMLLLGDGVMVRKQLLGLHRRCERLAQR